MGQAKVKQVIYNWRPTPDGDYNFDSAEVGWNDVTEIIEHVPSNGMELWNFEIRKKDGQHSRIFNVNEVKYFNSI